MTATLHTAFPTPPTTQRNAIQAFGLFIALHLLLFTALPLLLTSNLTLDTIEALAWGHEWQWGYYKHPPMSAWLAEIFRCGTHDWSLYALSQVMVITAFIGAWLLACDLMGPMRATLAVMALEGVHYHNVTSIEFNANVVMYPFWAWASLAFWRALNTGKLGWWAALGLMSGMGTLGKYVFLTLPASMVLYLLLHPAGRAQWRRLGPWLAMAVFVAVMAPHLQWLLDHNAPTLHYAFDRGHAGGAQTTSHWAHELLNFLGAQVLALVPMLSLLAVLGWRPRHLKLASWPDARQWAMLTLGLGPLTLFVAAALLLQINLLQMWAAPLFLVSAPLLMGWRPPESVSIQQAKRFTMAVGLWVGLLASLYAAVLIIGPKLKHHADRTDYPGRQLATTIEAQWHQLTGQPLSIVVGETWVAGNVAAYSNDHPSVYIDGKPEHTLWLTDELVRQRGAVFVWSPKDHADPALMGPLLARFPGLKPMPDLTLTSTVGGHRYDTTVKWSVLMPKAPSP
jgi:4-amino-4-deoxy-L-arabinose transferase-like glycosyltransferase